MRDITTSTKAKEISRVWHEVDMQGKILGREATHIATKLTGKAKPYFVRHLDCGDHVVVINAEKLVVTGQKLAQKVYTSYSGYPGGLRSEQLKDMLKRKPEEVVRRAVSGMLPKNKLRDQMLKRLHIYAGSEHPHAQQLKGKKSDVKSEPKE